MKEMTTRQAELEGLSDDQLKDLLWRLEIRYAKLQRRFQREELFAAFAKRRVTRIAWDTVSIARLDNRIERLFEAVRNGVKPWPANEALGVVDGLASRLVSKRLTLGLIAVITIVPAFASLILLAKQNADMVEQNRAEEISSYKLNRSLLYDRLFTTMLQWDYSGEEPRQVRLPFNHQRIRAESFGTLIALDKQRWTDAERTAMPPTRYVDLRSCNLYKVSVGGRIGLIRDQERNDFSRVFLENANLVGASFLNSKLDGSVFRYCEAQGATFSSPSAIATDFTGIQAENAEFYYDPKSQTPLDLTNSNFSQANLRNAVFEQAWLQNCDFESADFTGSKFDTCQILECDFTTALLGNGIDFSNTVIHKTLFLEEQLENVILPPFGYVEETETEEVKRVMTNAEQYEAWYAEQAAIMEKLANEELRELGFEGTLDDLN